MSNIDKQALRQTAEKAQEHGVFNMDIHSETVLAILDELEAKDSMIAAQQHEIRTLLNALEGRPCPKCNDTGMADSGGTQPWGEPISVPCDCAAPPAPVVPDAIEMDDDFDSAFEHGKAVGWNACRAAMLQGKADQAPVKQPSSNSIVGWLRADYRDDNRGLRGNAPLFVLGKKDPSSVWGLDYIPLTGNSPVIPDGYALVPKEMTDEIGEAISMRASCCGGIALDIYDAMLTAAPQEVK